MAIGAGVAVLILAVIGGAAWWFFSFRDKNPQDKGFGSDTVSIDPQQAPPTAPAPAVPSPSPAVTPPTTPASTPPPTSFPPPATPTPPPATPPPTTPPASSTPPPPPVAVAVVPPGDASFLPNGDFQNAPPTGIATSAVVGGPVDPANRSLAMGSEDYQEMPVSIPAEVKGLHVTMRVLVPAETRFATDGLAGIRFRVSLLNDMGGRGVSDAILTPAPDWQELEFYWFEAGSDSTGLGLETTAFEGRIYVDDIKVTKAFPMFFSETAYEYAPEPAQLIYHRMMDQIMDATGGDVEIGSPVDSGDGKRVEIDIRFDGEAQTFVSVETRRTSEEADVIFGLKDSEGDLFRLRQIDGRWAIVAFEEFQ